MRSHRWGGAMSRDLPIHDAFERIEAALVKAMRSRFGNAVWRNPNTGDFIVDGGEDDVRSLNLSELARDMERELSC